MSSPEPNSITLIRPGSSHDTLKMFLIHQVLRTQGNWTLARYRIAGTKSAEWSLFVYRGSNPRQALAAHLKAPPENLSLSTMTGEPLEVEWTGDALLDRALKFCLEGGLALPLDPEPLAALSGSPWPNARAVKNWRRGAARIIQAGPPDGWNLVEYRLASRRGGRASVAWVPSPVGPSRAIAKALGVTEAEIVFSDGETMSMGVAA
jgi:hypothetical protein